MVEMIVEVEIEDVPTYFSSFNFLFLSFFSPLSFLLHIYIYIYIYIYI